MPTYQFTKNAPTFSLFGSVQNAKLVDQVDALVATYGITEQRTTLQAGVFSLTTTVDLTAQQEAAIADLIAGYEYVDVLAIKTDATAALKQDDLFGNKTLDEVINWIVLNFDDPTAALTGQVDTMLGTLPSIKSVLNGFLALEVKRNQALKKLARRLYEIIDLIDPTINPNGQSSRKE